MTIRLACDCTFFLSYCKPSLQLQTRNVKPDLWRPHWMEICWFMICWFPGLGAFQPRECLCVSKRLRVWSRPQCALGCTRFVVTPAQQLEQATDEEFQSFVCMCEMIQMDVLSGEMCAVCRPHFRVSAKETSSWNGIHLEYYKVAGTFKTHGQAHITARWGLKPQKTQLSHSSQHTAFGIYRSAQSRWICSMKELTERKTFKYFNKASLKTIIIQF